MTEESHDGIGCSNRATGRKHHEGTIGKPLKRKEAEYNRVSVPQPHQHARWPEPAAGATGSECGKMILIFWCGRVGSFFLSLSPGLAVKHKVNTFSKT